MKEIIKKWWFWLIILLIVTLICITIFAVLGNTNGGMGTAGISKNEFEEIKLGMSQFEVNGIIDKLDEWDEDSVYEKACEEISKTYKNSIYTYEYKYYGEKAGYAIITYEADYNKGSFEVPEVVKKEQFNLK